MKIVLGAFIVGIILGILLVKYILPMVGLSI